MKYREGIENNYLDLSKALEKKSDCINLLKQSFGYGGSIETGAFYILPDGSAIKSKEHSDIDKFLIKNKFIKIIDKDEYNYNSSGNGSLFMDAINCVRIRRRGGRDSWLLPYIVLPEKDLTNEQYRVIKDWVDFVLSNSGSLDVETMQGKNKVFKSSNSSTDKVINAIKRFYKTNILTEVLRGAGMGNIESMTKDILMEELTPDLVKKIAKALDRNKALTSTYALTVSVEDLLSTNRNSSPSESGFYFILEGTRSGVSFFYNNNLEFSRKPNSKSVRVVKRYNNLRGFEESFWLKWAEKWLKNDLVEKIVKKSDGYYVTSEDGEKNLGGPYDTEDKAKKRLQQVHYFKNKDKKVNEEDTPKQKTLNRKSKRDIKKLAIDKGFDGLIDVKDLSIHHIDSDSRDINGLKDNSYKNLWFIKGGKNWKDRELVHKVIHFMDRNNVSYDDLLDNLEDFKLYQYDEETGNFRERTLSMFREEVKVNESIWGEMERQSRDRQKRIDDLKVGKKVYKVSTRNNSYTIKADNVDDAYRKVNTLSQVKGFYNDYKNGDYWVVEVEKENFNESLTEDLNDREKRIILGAIEAIDWEYHMIAPEDKKITCGLLVLPKAQQWQDGSVTDFPLAVEDEDGHIINFDNKEEAQQWFEQNKDKLDVVRTRDGYKLVVLDEEELVTEEAGNGLTYKEVYDEIKGKYHTKKDQLKAIAGLIWAKGYKNIKFVDVEDALATAMELQDDMFGWYDPSIEEYDDIVFSLGGNRKKR